MPWKEVTQMSQKKEFIYFATQPNANVSQLCKLAGITRKTGYKWLKRYREHGEEGLHGLSRRPHSHPDVTPEDVVKNIILARYKHPAWGGRKLRAWLIAQGNKSIPSASTITKILKRHSLIAPDTYQQSTAWQRFERAAPNELWQMDFKGHVGMHNGKRCHPLTILDDCSRFSVALRAMTLTDKNSVKEQLINVFRQYGIPQQINVDNGPPWGSAHSRYTALSLWLMRIGIKVSFSRFGHPQTNGKDERFHRTLKAELLQYHIFKDVADAQRRLDGWRFCYNHERPHESLNLQPPITRYHPSQVAYPSVMPPIEYGPEDRIRKISKRGYLRFENTQIYLGEGFACQPVGIREVENNKYDVYYCATRIYHIDLNQVDN